MVACSSLLCRRACRECRSNGVIGLHQAMSCESFRWSSSLALSGSVRTGHRCACGRKSAGSCGMLLRASPAKGSHSLMNIPTNSGSPRGGWLHRQFDRCLSLLTGNARQVGTNDVCRKSAEQNAQSSVDEVSKAQPVPAPSVPQPDARACSAPRNRISPRRLSACGFLVMLTAAGRRAIALGRSFHWLMHASRFKIIRAFREPGWP